LQGSADFGASLTRLGDYNADGAADLAVGAPKAQERGVVSIFLGGSTPTLTPAATLIGTSVALRFGEALSGGSDVNDDGFDDLLIGTPKAPLPNEQAIGNAGEVRLVFGGSAPFTGNTPSQIVWSGTQVGGELGAALWMLAAGTKQENPAQLFFGAPGMSAEQGRVFRVLTARQMNGWPALPVANVQNGVATEVLNGNGAENFGSSFTLIQHFHGGTVSSVITTANRDALFIAAPLGNLSENLAVGRVQSFDSFDLSAQQELFGEVSGDLFGASLATHR
jgi:hypothetical protein